MLISGSRRLTTVLRHGSVASSRAALPRQCVVEGRVAGIATTELDNCSSTVTWPSLALTQHQVTASLHQSMMQSIKQLHTASVASMAARRDGNASAMPDRVKNWKKYLSKRAKKRRKRKVAKAQKHAANRKEQSSALMRRGEDLPAEYKMEEDSRINEMLIDVLNTEMPPKPSPREGIVLSPLLLLLS